MISRLLLAASALLLITMTDSQLASAINSSKLSEGWIDVTAPLSPATTPVFPGDDPIHFKFLKKLADGDPVTLSAYSLGAHSGTHIDAPMHFILNGESTDKIPLDTLIGGVRVIDCSVNAKAIDAVELAKHDWKGAHAIFFRTRNSRQHWMTDPQFQKDFTYLAPDAARMLADSGVKLVGIDYISMEQFGAAEPLTHRTLLDKGIPIVEGLMLDDVAAGDYEMIVAPMKVMGHEGVPVRALVRKITL